MYIKIQNPWFTERYSASIYSGDWVALMGMQIHIAALTH